MMQAYFIVSRRVKCVGNVSVMLAIGSPFLNTVVIWNFSSFNY